MTQATPRQPRPDVVLPMHTWTVVADGRHNAFTDMYYWRDAFWLAYISSPGHFASSRSRLVLLRSLDAIHWREVIRFSGAGQDIRDPKLAVVHGCLMVYALLNRKFDPQPYKTICTQSVDGETWGSFADVTPAGWLLGKPKTFDGATWYAPAHHLAQGAARLLRSFDGIDWETQAVIYEQSLADETALVFTQDGHLLAATRLEGGPGIGGHSQGGTLISFARPPYQKWEFQIRSAITRLDGPSLFFSGGQIYAVGRFQIQAGRLFHRQGSIFSRKRTAIFRVDGRELVHLVDLPSCGDTSYAGVVLRDDDLWISYYTNDPGKDISWISGMFRPTQIQITRISLSALSDYNHQR